jgi:phage shock protein PspC (stress-responsive transcriptional regulator)
MRRGFEQRPGLRRRSRGGASFQIPERPWSGRLVGGVAAGLAERFGLDPTLVRLAFLVLALSYGIGLVLYGVLWVVMPEPGVGGESLGQTARRNLEVAKVRIGRAGPEVQAAWQRLDTSHWPRPLDRRWMAIAGIAVGVLVILASLGAFDWLTPARALGLAAIAVGAAGLVGMRS